MTDESDEVKLKLPGYGLLSEPARQQFHRGLGDYAAEVLAESSRLEERWRTDGAEPQITSRDVSDAFVLINRLPKSRKSTRTRVCDTIAFASAFIGGVFGNMISTPQGAIGFSICAFVGVIAYTNRGDE